MQPTNDSSAKEDEVVYAKGLLDRLKAANIPRSNAEVLVCVDVLGLPYREVAEMQGVPLGTIMSRLHRGRTRFAKLLETDVASKLLLEKDPTDYIEGFSRREKEAESAGKSNGKNHRVVHRGTNTRGLKRDVS